MIQPCYYKGERGNKPYPLEIMLRLYLLQNLYDLSDEATVAEAIDSRAFSEFCQRFHVVHEARWGSAVRAEWHDILLLWEDCTIWRNTSTYGNGTGSACAR